MATTRKGASMATVDYDRMWETLTATTDLANRTATNVASLTEAVRGQHDRISKIENSPAGIRGWLSLLIAGAGLLASLACSGAGFLLAVWTYLHH